MTATSGTTGTTATGTTATTGTTGRRDRPSPLHTEHVRLGALFTRFAGWRMPLRYGSELAEHHAVRTAAGLFDLSHMGQLDVRGPRAAEALDHALTGALSRVGVGRARYTLLCSPDGGVLDDLVVYRVEEHRFLLVVNAANTARDLAAITERAAGFDAAVADRTAETALIAVQGPTALAGLTALSGPDDAPRLAGLRYYAVTPATVAGVEVLVARTGYTGEDGFELYLAPDRAPALWRALRAAGEPHGWVPAGLACRDTLRLEAGMALYGHELDPSTTPYAAGLRRAVALDTDFVGRAALARLARIDPPRVLVGLLGEGRRSARAGDAVLGPRGPVGRVSSGALSPTLGRPIALAYVGGPHRAPGTELMVDVRGRHQPYTVVEPPFHRSRPATPERTPDVVTEPV